LTSSPLSPAAASRPRQTLRLRAAATRTWTSSWTS
jgi:hypothetical protein